MFRLLRQHASHWMAIIALIDGLLLLLAVGMASRVRYAADAAAYAEYSTHLFWRGVLFALVILLCECALGLYQAQSRETRLGVLVRQAVGFGIGTLLLTILYYLVPQAYIGRGVLGLAVVFGFGELALWRLLVSSLMDVELLKRRILVFGAGELATIVARLNSRTFSIAGFVAVPGETVKVSAARVVAPGPTLHEWALARQIDEIVVVPDDRRGTLPMTELLECRQHGIGVTDLVRFLERESGKVRLGAPPSWLVFSDGFRVSSLRRASKRVFDIFAAALILMLSWPWMLLTALAIRIESGPGQPILYFQDRVGERGRVFRLVKFRSMRTDAERDGIARWASKDDARVTRVGRVIRKLRLDELPQLWNVLNGTMSFIGPRPERPEFVAGLAQEIPYYTLRHCVKPGLTGWAQLRYPYGSSAEDAAEKLTFDLFYVKNHNLRFDAMIFLQTVEVVLFGRGAR
jgi:sugar transferase (PEP-CTERM system associated)